MKGLLNAAGGVFSWTEFFNKYSGDASQSVTLALNWVTTGVWILAGVAGLAGVIYSIYLGIQLAKAEDQSKREDAKKHLITVIIAIAVTLVLILFFLHILPAIVSAFSGISGTPTT